MTSPRRFEHDLPVLLADMYLARTPDYRDDLVQRIARVRQRPAWTFPERWLPMDLATKALPGATRIPWRIVGVLALMAALLAGMLAFYAGSQRRLPEPFGPAANGALVFAADGDILSADPVTGRTATLVSSPEIDSASRPVARRHPLRVPAAAEVDRRPGGTDRRARGRLRARPDHARAAERPERLELLPGRPFRLRDSVGG